MAAPGMVAGSVERRWLQATCGESVGHNQAQELDRLGEICILSVGTALRDCPLRCVPKGTQGRCALQKAAFLFDVMVALDDSLQSLLRAPGFDEGVEVGHLYPSHQVVHFGLCSWSRGSAWSFRTVVL